MWDTHSFRKAHQRYQVLRAVAYAEALDAVRAAGLVDEGCALEEIIPETIEVWRQTWGDRRHWTGDGGWPWDKLARRYCRKPRSFHVAAWHRDHLCALAVGRVSQAHRVVTLHFMEGAPNREHGLRGAITYLVFTAAEFYARAVGAEFFHIKNPLPGVLERYGTFGFDFAYEERGNTYYGKQLN